MKKILALLFLFVSMPALGQSPGLLPEAPWTQEEYDSIVSMDAGCLEAADTARFILEDWKFDGQDTEVNRQVTSDALVLVGSVLGRCNEARASLVGSNHAAGGGPNITRDDQVDRARSRVNTAINDITDVLTILPSPFTKARSHAEASLAGLNGFDPSLSYAEFRPSYYPAIVGLHGDYDFTFDRFADALRYMCASMVNDIGRLVDTTATPTFTDFARTKIGGAGFFIPHVCNADQRAFSIEALIFQPDDWARIQEDTDAARLKNRGPTFFKTILATEYAFGDKDNQPAHFSARPAVNINTPDGAISIVNSVSTAVSGQGSNLGLADVNTGEWARKQLKRTGPVEGATEAGYIEMLLDIIDGWDGHDEYAYGLFGFFHDVTSPPGAVCDPDTTVEIDGTCFGNLVCPEHQVQYLGIDAAGQVSAQCVEVQ